MISIDLENIANLEKKRCYNLERTSPATMVLFYLHIENFSDFSKLRNYTRLQLVAMYL